MKESDLNSTLYSSQTQNKFRSVCHNKELYLNE